MDGSEIISNHSILATDVWSMINNGRSPQLIDVRRRELFDATTGIIPGSVWRDMATLPTWIGHLDPQRPVIVVCAHGHERSQGTTERLREAGLSACFLEGGYEAWDNANLPFEAKAQRRAAP
ncbi:MAG: thiosulfate sulfurtransferase GlpE [Pseudolabrys sp.]|nr:thiosulfate sulfurtransferase GlpE [Pseudolabrys sp.]